MTLSKHVNVEALLQAAEDHPHLGLLSDTGRSSRAFHNLHYGRYQSHPIPKYKLPESGIDGSAAYNIIKDELSLDGKPTLNLASFVHTAMDEHATRLMSENVGVNLCDQDEYPATMAIHGRCISMLADLWHAPHETDAEGKHKAAQGVATTGSSEAIMLGVLAMKKVWQAKRKAQGKSFKEPGPNLVYGANAQVAIEKASRYFDIEERLVPTSKESHYRMDPTKAINMVDENTIGVIVILGSTYTGAYEPVDEMSKLLDEYESKTGIHIPIHVDAASGGFVAPFAHPSLKWDFSLPRVVSINTSGHKFGGAYPGIGWIVLRNEEVLPKELVFELHYLGSVEYSFGLNFSRPAAPVIAQYYNLIQRGFEGYRLVMEQDLRNARLLSRALENSSYYDVLSDIHKPAGAIAGVASKVRKAAGGDDSAENYVPGLPVVAFKWTQEFQQQNPHLEQRWMQTLLRAKGWIVPNYELAPDCQSIQILRVVVRSNLSEDMIDQLITDIMSITEDLVDSSSASAHLANHHHKHKNIRKEPHSLPAGSGNVPTGYAKQC
ncbi:glutamate decarboxylase [Ceraceosorus bombacis]|uniref:Glutamate decarboxylase n=1 Tax=Ceraceosorus bombacis TaxID=401625 RepID=A0A0P1BL75_9BASI|nr:glutamate decarboxylase [Ceraceosorus bombacis]